MLNYNEFKNNVKNTILDYFPDDYGECRVQITRLNKTNRTLDCLNIVPIKNEEAYAMPNLYLEELYEDYKKDGDLEKTICQGAEMISRWMNKLNNVERANLFPFKENMISVLVNAELNRELLEGMPHRTFLDLAEICKCIIIDEEKSISCVNVTYGLMEGMNLDEETLFEISSENTRKNFPVVIEKINDLIGIPSSSQQIQIYVLSNRIHIAGANAMLDQGVFRDISEMLEADLIILPSSIHEVLVMPDVGQNRNEIREIISRINRETVDLSDRLSDNVYLYEKSSGNIVIV